MQSSRLANIIYSTAKRCINTKKWYCGYRSIWNENNPLYSLNYTGRYCFSTATTNKVQNVAKNFSEFITDQTILQKLQKNGITKMFPVQEETFKLIQAGIDILASDRTGSGKTLGYTLPVLQKFNKANYHLTQIKDPKFLILCPTRQLVIQVSNQIKKINSIYRVLSVYGGSSIERQISEINRGIAIVVATPGRLIDLLKRESLRLKDLEVVCIDEADTMLEKGFKDDIQQIFQFVRKSAGTTQNIMFSATIPVWVNKIAKEYFNKNMKRINMVKDEDVKTSQTVQHYALYVKRSQRHKIVQNLIEKYNPHNRTIIFTRMKVQADDFMYQFKNNKIVILHGDVPQRIREQNINHFRRGSKKVLIATDIAARGIDIPDVQLIIQLSPPQNAEQYIHRSGRTGRAGKEGINITLFDQSNVEQLLQAQRSANINMKIIDDSHNIAFWNKKLARLSNSISISDQNEKKNVEQFLKKAKLQKEFLQSISFLSNQKGFISFIAYPKNKKSQLTDSFQGIQIHNKVTDNQGIKFDISVEDYSNFEQAVNKQQQFQVQQYTQYTSMTLSALAKKLAKSSSYSDNRRKNSHNSNRRSEGRQQRDYGNERTSRYGQERYRSRDEQPRQNRYQNKEQRQSQRKTISVSQLPEGLSAYRLFLYGFSPEVTDSDFKEEIKNQMGLTQYKLKIIKKIDDQGVTKTFGFIQFPSKQDCSKFMDNKLELNGQIVKKKVAQDRR